jgi:hypothetical protein
MKVRQRAYVFLNWSKIVVIPLPSSGIRARQKHKGGCPPENDFTWVFERTTTVKKKKCCCSSLKLKIPKELPSVEEMLKSPSLDEVVVPGGDVPGPLDKPLYDGLKFWDMLSDISTDDIEV